ncbi:unnamed protein product [Thelazia callipaeda]|uniref:NADPH:adrenodoxin oxidoreductase, mitochondrial n=1 Tax=Thelazia callipaeda TaxID=103827 RepID=A0A0N5CJQ6_THECL|nr:unnamed protein product [Thelazia callipaeda]
MVLRNLASNFLSLSQVKFFLRTLVTFSRPPHIAIVGSGPAGLYTCSGVLRRLRDCFVDIYESNIVPFGLLRYGVAPDHPEMKNCLKHFDKMFSDHETKLKLYCNVSIGQDIKFDELCSDYDAVVLAYGARRQRRLNIPGINARNIFSGGDFVFWYNGMYGITPPILECKEAVIIGNGNVALDCSRMLLSAGTDRLIKTDIPTPVLDILSHSQIRRITIIGRRSPLDVSFTIKELKEQITLPNCSFSVEIDDHDKSAIENAKQSLPRPRKRIMELLLNSCSRNIPQHDPYCQMLFRRTPKQVLMDSHGFVTALQVTHSLSEQVENLPCGLLIYCIGFENMALNGIPTDENGQIKMLDAFRVAANSKSLVYATGWCAHAPRGIIAHTQIDARNVAEHLVSDLQKHGLKSEAVIGSEERLLKNRIKYLTWKDWKKIDEEERRLGAIKGKQREKLHNFRIFCESP